jgi:hypothetical protein
MDCDLPSDLTQHEPQRSSLQSAVASIQASGGRLLRLASANSKACDLQPLANKAATGAVALHDLMWINAPPRLKHRLGAEQSRPVLIALLVDASIKCPLGTMQAPTPGGRYLNGGQYVTNGCLLIP